MDATWFGTWLKQRRKALDLTQEELAERVYCSPETIRKLEAGLRRPSKQVAKRLVQALDIPEEGRTTFLHLAHDASAQGVPAHPSSTLPTPPTRLILKGEGGRAI